ncbi:hypothetical protein [Flavimaricola marinus]|nr:hypothetical protein [Flavimaricola marinus]
MTCTRKAAPTSTIVQLLYADAPPISFPSLLGHLCETLCSRMGQKARLAVVNDDTAHLDMTHHRLTIALHVDLPGAAKTCLTLGIGPRPQAPEHEHDLNDAQNIAYQTDIARKLSDVITSRLPADQVLWHIAPRTLTSAMIEDLLEHLPHSLPKPSDNSSDMVDLSRVMDQVQVTLSGRKPARAKAPVRQHGNLPGFSGRVSAGQMAVGTRAVQERRRSNIATLRPMAPIAPPANDIPAVPQPNEKGLLRAHSALHHGRTRPATRLILSAGQSSERVIAFLSHAC